MEEKIDDFTRGAFEKVKSPSPTFSSSPLKKARAAWGKTRKRLQETALKHARAGLNTIEEIRTRGISASEWPVFERSICQDQCCPAEIKMAINYQRDLEGFFRVLTRLDSAWHNYQEPQSLPPSPDFLLGQAGAQSPAKDPPNAFEHLLKMTSVDYSNSDNLPAIFKACSLYEGRGVLDHLSDSE